MAQERNELDTVHGVAVQSLKNELALAVRLLLQVKESRETLAIESHVVDSARKAFRHASEALDRVPRLEPNDMQTVERLMDEFRFALAKLGD